MSEWYVEVVEVGKIGKHPDADRLSITSILGYPVIFQTEMGYKEGDLVAYVPVDSVVPDTEEWHWLVPRHQDGNPRYPVGQVPEKYRHIKAKKIRGIYSQGLLSPLPAGTNDWRAGMHVAEAMGITKWEPAEELEASSGGQAEHGPEGWEFIKYTDIEGLRRYKNVLQPSEEVVLTEKIHGQNARFCWDGERLWCGSRSEVKKEDKGVNWWFIAEKLELAKRFATFPKTIFYGEIFGKGIQKLTYDLKEKDFVIFDTFDVQVGAFNDWDRTVVIADQVGLPIVPVLYRGPWHGEELWHFAEGKSTIAGHTREGFVVKPTTERWDRHIGRVIFKLVGEGYHLEK